MSVRSQNDALIRIHPLRGKPLCFLNPEEVFDSRLFSNLHILRVPSHTGPGPTQAALFGQSLMCIKVRERWKTLDKELVVEVWLTKKADGMYVVGTVNPFYFHQYLCCSFH